MRSCFSAANPEFDSSYTLIKFRTPFNNTRIEITIKKESVELCRSSTDEEDTCQTEFWLDGKENVFRRR
jgi:hypothetical protein